MELLDKILVSMAIGSFLLWFSQVFISIKNNLLKFSKARVIQNLRMNQDVKNDSRLNNKLSLFKLINNPVLQILSQSQKEQQHKTLDTQKSVLGKLTIFFYSLIFSTIVCILIVWIIMKKQVLNQMSQIFSSFSPVINLIFQSPKQNLLPLIESDGNEKILYQSKIQISTIFFHLIGNFVFIVRFLRSIRKCKTNRNNASSNKKIINLILGFIMILTNPSFISILVLEFLLQIFEKNYSNQLIGQEKSSNFNIYHNKRANSIFKQEKRAIIKIIGFLLFIFTSIWYFISENKSFVGQTYLRTLFPQQFSPQSNLMWIFYAHMFNRYLGTYQVIMFILPVSFTIPLSMMKISKQTKYLCQYFVIIFTSYQSSNLQIYLFWVLVLTNLKRFESFSDPLMRKINKSLGIVAFTGSTFFFLVYNKMVEIYTSSWMVNIGYPFVFGCIAWALIAIWIVELIKIQLQQIGNVPYQDEEEGKVTKMIKQIKNFIKNKLWTKKVQY